MEIPGGEGLKSNEPKLQFPEGLQERGRGRQEVKLKTLSGGIPVFIFSEKHKSGKFIYVKKHLAVSAGKGRLTR